MEKTKEDILLPVLPMILDKNFTSEEKKKFILNAMEEYRKQGRNFTQDEICQIQTIHYDKGYEAGVEWGINNANL